MNENIVVVDNREPEHIYETLIFLCSTPKFDFFRVRSKQLPIGDFVFRNLCVERKTQDDFIKSIQDGRIYEQCYNMSQNFDHAAIIVSGDYVGLTNSQKKSMCTIAADTWFRYNIPTISTETDEHLCYLLLQMCNKYASNLQPAMPVKRAKRVIGDEILTVLISFPEIGKVKAKQILSEYGSLYQIAISTPVEMAKRVKGVGIKSANKFYKILRSRWS